MTTLRKAAGNEVRRIGGGSNPVTRSVREIDAVLALALSLVHVLVGSLYKGSDLLALVIVGDPDAHRNTHRLKGNREKDLVGKTLSEPFRRHPGIPASGFCEDHCEFFSSIPVPRIGPSDRTSDHRTEPGQHLIAGKMAIGVVIYFEIVYIDQQERQRMLVPLDAVNLSSQLIVEVPLVEQTREVIRDAEILVPSFALP
jgi:hypothetical protein